MTADRAFIYFSAAAKQKLNSCVHAVSDVEKITAMNVENTSPTVSDLNGPKNDGVQFASGGNPGLEMAAPTAIASQGSGAEPELSPTTADFLMIQLSSFEGRAEH